MINRRNVLPVLAALIVSLLMWWALYKLGEYVWFHFQRAVVIELAEEIKREGI